MDVYIPQANADVARTINAPTPHVILLVVGRALVLIGWLLLL